MPPDTDETSPTHGSPTLFLILAAAAAVIIFAIGGFLGDEDPNPDTSPFTSPTTVPSSRGVVDMVGDSITELNLDGLRADLTRRGYTNAVAGYGGTTILANRARLLGAIEVHPDVLIVELGTNDIGGLYAADQFPMASDREAGFDKSVSLMKRTLHQTASIECVLWLNISDWTKLPNYDTTDYGPRFNEELANQIARHDNAHLVDYHALFAPSTPERAAYLSANFDNLELHPQSDDARAKYVELVGSAVDGFCGL